MEDVSSDELDIVNQEVPKLPEAVITNGNDRQKSRKRKQREDDLEDQYMRRLAREEKRETKRREAETALKRQKTSNGSDVAADEDEHNEDDVEDDNQESDAAEDMDASSPPPQHESLSNQPSAEVDKASRTVFLSNVSIDAITSKSSRKVLLAHLSTHLPALPPPPKPHKEHKIESYRFRSTAFSSPIPKKAAFAKKELMDATTKSTNAYVVYNTVIAAREAAKRLNGSIVLDRHLRVDEVAHPAKAENKRCVFVGNLGFVNDESTMEEGEDGGKKKKKKQKQPADVEEGLWREFSKAGTVESVRVVRDPKTRVGKGFAYVQFTVSHLSLSQWGILLLTAPSHRTKTLSRPLYCSTTRNSLRCCHANCVSQGQRPSSAMSRPNHRLLPHTEMLCIDPNLLQSNGLFRAGLVNFLARLVLRTWLPLKRRMHLPKSQHL